jgi:hypothetical protein
MISAPVVSTEIPLATGSCTAISRCQGGGGDTGYRKLAIGRGGMSKVFPTRVSLQQTLTDCDIYADRLLSY